MSNTEQIPYQTYRDGVLIDSGTVTLTLAPAEVDQDTIRANIAAAKTALQNATATVNAATNTTAVAALQGYVQANNQAWQALLPALKYIAERLSS